MCNNFKSIFKLFIVTCSLFLMFPFYCFATEMDNSEELSLESFSVSALASSAPEINSRAAIVLEKSTGTILYGKNENEQRKMASTTKIMTCVVVLENVTDLSEIVTISKKAAGIGGSRLGLTTNAQVTVKDLLYGLMLCSGNDAAIALAEFAGGSVEGFAALMNNKALELGLINTHFVTPHGLDNDEHYTTAYELALLTNYALKNETFCKIVSTHSYSVMINNSSKSIHNTNELLGYLNGVYGVKTGFTNGANRCLVSSCKRGNMDIICIVLGADTKKFRTKDSIKLIEYAFSNFEMVDISSIIENEFSNWQSENSRYFSINKGIGNYVSTRLQNIEFKYFPVNKANIKDINVKFSCDFSFDAPLLEDTKIGSLYCNLGEKNICELAIYCSNSILKKDISFYFKNFIENYSFYLENIFKELTL